MINNLTLSTVVLQSTSYLHDAQYMPAEYVYALILIGFIGWALLCINKDLEVLFGFLSIISFGASAWYAAYMTIETSGVVVVGTTITYVHSQILTPQPVLQIILVVCFIFSILAEIYVVFLREADKQLEVKKIR